MNNHTPITDPNKAYGFSSEYDRYNVRKMIRNRTNKEGQTKVIIEVCQYKYIETGKYKTYFRRIETKVWTNPKHWDKKKQAITIKDSGHEFKNKEIDKVYAAVKAYVNSKGVQSPDQAYVENLDLYALSEFFPAHRQNRKNLVDYFTDYIEKRKLTGTNHNTLKEFTTVKNRVDNYDKYKGKKTYLDDITILWSEDFYLFLQTLYSEGTIEKTYTVLYTVLNYYYDLKDELKIELTDKFKSKRFKKGTKSKNAANPLTQEQLDTLRNHIFEDPHLKMIQERFLWQCYTGIRYKDAFTVTRKNIENGWLRFIPTKTQRHSVKVEQPINDVAKEILQKYDYDMTKLQITNQAYNRELKTMFEKLQKAYPKLHYQINYGTYCSRDTYISMCVQGGANWKDILKWVGQSSYAIMDRYIKTEDKGQEESVKRIFKKSN
jgi:hypothetical protein